MRHRSRVSCILIQLSGVCPNSLAMRAANSDDRSRRVDFDCVLAVEGERQAQIAGSALE